MIFSRNGSRLAVALGAIAAGVVITACADKAFRPPVNASPKIQLQINTAGAQQVNAGGKKQILVVVAAYRSSVIDTSNGNGDKNGFRQLAGVVAQVTGASQTVTLNVDLSGCLADGTRLGSQSACSLYYAAFLRDSAGFSLDTSSFDKGAYDIAINGPIDVAPGRAPVLPTITLSQTRYSVFQFVGDEALRLGGPQTPNGFSGAITGTVAGVAPGNQAILFALTSGFVQGSTNCSPSNPTSCNAPQLAIFQGGTWKRFNGPQGVPQFNDVAAFAVNDVYLAGQNAIYHFDGSAISVVSGTTGENVVSIGAITSGTAKYVVAGTSAGNAWFGNTTSWTKSPVNVTGGQIDVACVTGANEAFALNAGSGNLYRFNGTSWTPAPTSFGGPKSDLQCPAPNQVYVQVGATAILNWNGSSFSAIPNPPRSGRLAVVSNSEIYVAADSGNTTRNFYRYNGSSWSLVSTGRFTQPATFRPWADPRGGAAYFPTAFGRIDMATPSGSHAVSYNPSIRDAIMSSPTSAFAVGYNLFLARFNGVTWTVDQPPAGTPTVRILTGVWSDGPSNAWTVGNQSTILHFDGTSWGVVSDVNHQIAGFDNYNAVWGTGGSVWIVGNTSIVRCRNLSSCTPDPVTGIDTLYGIWGSSTTNAWAVGARGKILHFDGTQWTSVASPTTHRMVRVWGSGPSDVYAVGDSVLSHYNGTAWTSQNISDITGNNNFVQPQQSGGSSSVGVGLWGANSRDVYLGTFNSNIVRWDGDTLVGNKGWKDVPSPSDNGGGGGRIVAIAGSAGGCVFAVIDGLTAGFASTLLRGVGPTGTCGSATAVTLPWP